MLQTRIAADLCDSVSLLFKLECSSDQDQIVNTTEDMFASTDVVLNEDCVRVDG